MAVLFNIGDIITSNNPLASVLTESNKSIYCDYCFFNDKPLKRCSKCRHMYYCDSTCQKSDWKKHKYECDIYLNYYDVLNSSLDRYLLRLYLFLNNNKPIIKLKQKIFDNSCEERSFDDLMTHRFDIENDQQRFRCFQQISKRFEDCNIEFDKQDLFSYFCKICINTFSILNSDLNEIGNGLYVGESVFDHSCSPNAAPVFNGLFLEIRAIKEIKHNDTININYIDLKYPREYRQNSLRSQYYFDCKCSRCESNFDEKLDYDHLRSLNADMDQSITQESKWLKAYKLGIQSIELFNQIYDCVHPDLTVQLVRLVKLRLLICGDLDNEGIQLVSRTDKLIKLTHGCNHQLFKIFKNCFNC